MRISIWLRRQVRFSEPYLHGKVRFNGQYLLVIFVISVFWSTAFARPQYAIRNGVNRCTTCHASPTGGEIRNLTGLAYGFKGYEPSDIQKQDLFAADLRALYFYPDFPTDNSGGLAWMNLEASANLPLTKEPRLNAVIAQNIGGFTSVRGAANRPTYLRIQSSEEGTNSLLPQYILVGRFVEPFGLLTDEHRTYTKIQSQTTWYDVEMGVLFSSNIWDELHYDLSFVNAQDTAGANLGTSNSTLWGTVLNLRWMFQDFPLALGVSGSYHNLIAGASSYAQASYLMLSLARLKPLNIPVDFIVEYVQARNLNSTISDDRFVSNSSYLSDPNVISADSVGWYGEVNWDLSDKFSLIYKFDLLALNKNYLDDAYTRHGAGFKYFFGPNLYTMFRYEWARAGHPIEAAATSAKQGRLSAAWALMVLTF